MPGKSSLKEGVSDSLLASWSLPTTFIPTWGTDWLHASYALSIMLMPQEGVMDSLVVHVPLLGYVAAQILADQGSILMRIQVWLAILLSVSLKTKKEWAETVQNWLRYDQNSVLSISPSILDRVGSFFFCFQAELTVKSVDLVSVTCCISGSGCKGIMICRWSTQILSSKRESVIPSLHHELHLPHHACQLCHSRESVTPLVPHGPLLPQLCCVQGAHWLPPCIMSSVYHLMLTRGSQWLTLCLICAVHHDRANSRESVTPFVPHMPLLTHHAQRSCYKLLCCFVTLNHVHGGVHDSLCA